jgi:hypothetical protein
MACHEIRPCLIFAERQTRFRVTGHEKDSPASRPLAGLDVGRFIANHEGTTQIEIELFGRLPQHLGGRLATAAFVRGRVWTIKDAAEPYVVFRQARDDLLMDKRCFCRRYQTAADTRLIADQDQGEPVRLDFRQSFTGACKEADLVGSS